MVVEEADKEALRVVRECMKDERTMQRIWEFSQLRPLDVVNHVEGVRGVGDHTLGVIEQYGLARVYISALQRIQILRDVLFWTRAALAAAFVGWALTIFAPR